MTMPTLTERAHDGSVGDPALPERPKRRRFDADYKLTILADYDRMTGSGEKGAFLRREGLYGSHVTEWRRAREAGLLHRAGSDDLPAGPKPATAAATAGALAKETRRADRAEAQLAKHKLALEIMGKASDGRPVAAHRCGMKSWWGRPLTSTMTGAC
jgi:transposase-like protein